MSEGPVLETERLILRPPLAEDFEPWAAFAADEEAARFLGGAQGRSGAWRALCTMAGAWTIRGFSMFSVIEKASGRWVGRLGPWQPEEWPGTEVGWGIVRDAWGRGYATEG
jgi:RimJ/RimL family protein N-acetyltransferase